MTISRRRFIKLLGAAIGGSVLGYGSILYLQTRFPGRVWFLNEWLTSPPLEETPPGRLDDAVLDTVISATQTLIALPIETAHYEAYFRWYASTQPGYKTLYRDFATTLNEATQATVGRDFVACETSTRVAVLQKAFQIREAESRLARLRYGLFDRAWVRFDHFIIREVFSLYARTDALVALGYVNWPSQPRGLDRYRQSPV